MSASENQDLVTLTIDGQEVSVPKGTLIIRAAEQLGTIVPRFCDHPLLDPVGACRQCVVDVEGQRKPVMSCTMPVAPDMVVRTHLTSDMAKKAQEGTLEFLLINHPLDCPMCDKGGECPLQDQALAHGANVSRFVDQKRRYQKPVAVSQQILLDRERCVLCARCTRFSEQVSGDPFIELFERGALEQVAIYEDEPYESYFSGNVIQICPVGALTSASYRFKARPFDVVTTPSVCDHCSAGCTLTVQSRRGEIQRQLARTNMAVNESWNCDKGRFGFTHLTGELRISEPRLRVPSTGGAGAAGELETASWSDVLLRVTGAIQEARDAGPGRVAVVTGSRLADEDAYAVSKYVRTVLHTDDLDHRTRFAGPGETEELTALVGADTAQYRDVEDAPVIVVAGLDPEEEVPILHLRIRKAWRAHKARIVVVGPHLGSLGELAWRRVATAPGQEAAAIAGLLDGDDDIATALRAEGAPVVLVGERAGAGTLTAGAALAAAAGGKAGYVARRGNARGALEAGLAAGILPGGRRLTDAADRAELEAHWGVSLPAEPGRDLHAILTDAAAGKIDVLHLIGVDLARDCASPELARRALEKVKLVVAQDLAATETVTRHADVVLPATGTQERFGSTTNWEGRTQRFAKVVDGPELAQEDWEIIVQLAALLGEDLGFSDLDQLRHEIATLGLRTEPHAFPPASVFAPAGEQRAGDATDDAVTTAGSSPAGGNGASEPRETGDPAALELVVRPLLLDRGTMLTGASDLLATARTPVVDLNTADAERLGIVDGAPVELSGNGATLRLTARVGHDVVPGAAVVPANSTDEPAAVLLGTDRAGQVTVSALEPAGDVA
ncbi:NADH-quinone oxidoreductase subunit G [Egicoccus halophilus]|uniref:NADH-quinone oxidoreductase n=1 Tax=Egicoccus halophilus TaxID=1670830 RepID=A0A8J3A7Q0_9ACTN|nr:NADH-quinone oxidoreductase subunit G [Egicoccus halophilus]GGI05727.1 NADH-quinone oxidoreductase [Egicoccus halophilus]